MNKRTAFLVFLSAFFFASNLLASIYIVDNGMSYAKIYKAPEMESHDYTKFTEFTGLCEFEEIEGYFNFKGEDPQKWLIRFDVNLDSLTTGDKVLENVLKGQDFFNAEENERISFYINPHSKNKAKVMIIFGDIIKFAKIKNFEIKEVKESDGIYLAATNNGIAKPSLKLKLSDLGIDIKKLLLYEIDPEIIGLKDEVNFAFHLRNTDPLGEGS